MILLAKDNIKTVTDLREQTMTILNSLTKRVGPTVIFHRANPMAVLLSIEAYEKLIDLLEDYLDEELALELEKKPQKKGIPLKKVMKELNVKPPKNV
jgi:PHD/YefM family antitoxin component YafN of YafNO toxin-antitoxin module